MMHWVFCRLAGRPKWLQLVLSRNFGAIALVNACMFMTQNGARAVLMPLLAIQGCGLSPKTLGKPACCFVVYRPQPRHLAVVFRVIQLAGMSKAGSCTLLCPGSREGN